MNLNGIMKKLQRAILQTGLVVKISTSQFYSFEQNRMINVYVLYTPIEVRKRTGEWTTRDYEILRTASGVEAVQCLQEIWESAKEWVK